MTRLGTVSVFRIGFQMHGGGMYYPLDELLKISETNITHGLKIMVAYLGALHPLRTAVKLIEMFWGIFLSHDFCSKLTCEVGAKAKIIEKRDLKAPKKTLKDKQHIAYEGDGGRAKIRIDIRPSKEEKECLKALQYRISGTTKEPEISEDDKKLHCKEIYPWIETKTTLVSNGEDSVQETVVGEKWETVMDDFAVEIRSKGYDTTPCNQALVSDGAQPIQDGFGKHFPEKQQILDNHHFSEHVNDAAKAIFTNELERKKWVQESLSLCFNNQSEDLLKKIELTKQLNTAEESQEQLRQLYNYTERNKERIRYGYFKDLGLPIGSGEIEAGIKTMNDTKKIKSASIRWRKSNLKNVVALRTLIFNDQFGDLKKAA